MLTTVLGNFQLGYKTSSCGGAPIQGISGISGVRRRRGQRCDWLLAVPDFPFEAI